MPSALAAALRDSLSSLLEPLALAASPQGLLALLQSVGHGSALAGHAPLQTAIAKCAGLVSELASLDDSELSSWEGAAKALQAGADIFAAINALEQAISDPTLASEAAGLGEAILGRLVAIWLRTQHPRLHRAAAALTLIDCAELATPSAVVVNGNVIVREAWRDDSFHLERAEALLKDPWGTLRTAYFPNNLAHAPDAFASANLFFPIVDMLVRSLGLAAARGLNPLDPPPPDATNWEMLDHFGDTTQGSDAPVPPSPPPDPTPFLLANMPRLLIRVAGADGSPQLGVELLISAADQLGSVAGVTVAVTGSASWSETSGGWNLQATTTGSIPAFVFGPGGVRLPSSTSPAAGATGSISVAKGAGGQPAFLLGDANASRIEVGDVRAQLDFVLSPSRQAIGFTAKVERAKLIVAAEGDGLLSEVLPSGGAELDCDLAITFWSDGGVDIGVAIQGLPPSAVMPVGKSMGPLTLQSITRSFGTVDTAVGSGLTVGVGVNLSFNFGPVTASLIGPSIAVDALWSLKDPTQHKNLGILHLDGLGLRPPTGGGLAIDAAGVVSGGGALAYDDDHRLYAGELQLSLSDSITVKAIGLIATKAPDGSPGFSLLVMITAEDFEPIQLGLGFNLQAIGGLIAVNRTFDQDVLRQDLTTNTLSTLLFPPDPVANAAAIIQSLSAAFPVQPGSYLIGLLARICWPTPTLVQMDLALVLQIGAQRRLLVLGRISSLLPSKDNDLLRINLDVLGVLDFDQGNVSIDGVLVDSRLAQKFTLSGAMALRAQLGGGSGSAFIMSIGGFDPRFTPPQGLPNLPRVQIALSAGDNPRLSCDAYFAITANTVQFGAAAQLYAAAYGFSIEGDVGFDVLIQTSPLQFIADFHASVQLKHGSDNLFKISVDGELDGPRPLKISGKASFEIFWCDFSISFNQALVDGPPPPPLPAVDLTGQLMAALSTPASWSNETPAGSNGVTLTPNAAAGQLVLDPSGRLLVRQRLVPLDTNRDIDMFGGAPISGDRRFTLTTSLGGQVQTSATSVQDQFAPAQFFAMTDDEKLAAPAFETFDAGLAFGEAISFPEAEIAPAPVAYDTILIDDLAPPPAQTPPPPYAIPAQVLAILTMSGAAARSATLRTGPSRFAGPTAGANVRPLTWVINPLADGPPQPPAARPQTWTEMRGTLAALNAGEARWQMTPTFELAA